MKEKQNLKEIQNYLEDKGLNYQVSTDNYERKKYEIIILTDYIEDKIMKILVNDYNFSIAGGVLTSWFTKK